jgi:hypothetical protein
MARTGKRISTSAVQGGGYPLDAPNLDPYAVVDCTIDVCVYCSQKAIVQHAIDIINGDFPYSEYGWDKIVPKYIGNEDMYEEEKNSRGEVTGYIVLKTPISPEYRANPKVSDWIQPPPDNYKYEEWQGRTLKTRTSYGTVSRGDYGSWEDIADMDGDESWLAYECWCCGSKLVDPQFGTWQ